MTLPNDFATFILTHGRPDRVETYDSLMKMGYQGRLYLVIDDRDKQGQAYRNRFGTENVLVFSKSEIAKKFDLADNFPNDKAIVYARNACFELAESVKADYFLQLDDDYHDWYIRFNERYFYCCAVIKSTITDIFAAFLDYYRNTPQITSIALSQGADHIGGGGRGIQCRPRLMRKCMNSFFCSIHRPFLFQGKINEDVNTYTNLGRQGKLFLTVHQAQLSQFATQSNEGGMTSTYLDGGTYLKTFYSILYSPSCVKISTLQDYNAKYERARIHHKINQLNAYPRIIREVWKKK